MKLKTLKDLGISVVNNSKIRLLAFKWIKELNKFFIIEAEIRNIRIEAKAREGSYYPDIEKIGKLEEYKQLEQKQNNLLNQLNIERFYEDFGYDSTGAIIQAKIELIKDFFNIKLKGDNKK